MSERESRLLDNAMTLYEKEHQRVIELEEKIKGLEIQYATAMGAARKSGINEESFKRAIDETKKELLDEFKKQEEVYDGKMQDLKKQLEDKQLKQKDLGKTLDGKVVFAREKAPIGIAGLTDEDLYKIITENATDKVKNDFNVDLEKEVVGSALLERKKYILRKLKEDSLFENFKSSSSKTCPECDKVFRTDGGLKQPQVMENHWDLTEGL